jgi:tellurite resistance protein
MSATDSKLKHLAPGWYAMVMGLTGLALAWHRAQPVMGEGAGGAALAIGALAALVFAALALATLLRGLRHPEAWAEDRRHPVRHTFIATLPIAVILLATVAVALFGPNLPAHALWAVGCAAQLFVTVWVLARWFNGNQAGGLQWAGVTPALFIPIVGNVLVPLAGVPLGHAHLAAAQFGLGLLFWPVVLVLIVVRIATQGLWPQRLLPTVFIFIAPPAVVGLSALQLGAPALVGWMCWGMALFCFLWAGTQARRIAAAPFSLPHWGMSFPLAALSALTLRLAALDAPAGAPVTGPMAVLGVALLALASLLIAALLLATLRGLRDGSLLAPEVAAPIVAAPAA